MANVVPMKPTQTVSYRSYTISLVYRPDTNDWGYQFEHTSTLQISGHGRSFDKALSDAKQRVDIVTRNLPKRATS